MAIAPISSVSFRNNYNQVNFEGKKREKSSGLHVSNSIKAIPLATLIALSPLNSSALDNSSATQANTRLEQIKSKRELVFHVALPKELGLPGAQGVMFYDTDNDPSDVEQAIYVISYNNGRLTEEIDISDGFIVETVNYKDGTPSEVNYCTKGKTVRTRRKSDGNKKVETSWGTTSIDKKAFDFITNNFENVFEIKYRTTVKDKKEMGGVPMFSY